MTGASSGIGRATALALANNGIQVMLGARRADRLSELESEITANGGTAASYAMDVTLRDQCKSMMDDAIRRWGRIDILVNNAGLMPLSFVKNLHVDEWIRMVDVNLKGVLYCTAAVLPYMLEASSGHIINISSVAGRKLFPSGSVYCATKHAVTAFSEGLRLELSPRKGIRVTSIEPGVVDTELTGTITDKSIKDYVESARRMEPLHSEDIAAAVIYAVNAPGHVNVNEILIRPTEQER